MSANKESIIVYRGKGKYMAAKCEMFVNCSKNS